MRSTVDGLRKWRSGMTTSVRKSRTGVHHVPELSRYVPGFPLIASTGATSSRFGHITRSATKPGQPEGGRPHSGHLRSHAQSPVSRCIDPLRRGGRGVPCERSRSESVCRSRRAGRVAAQPRNRRSNFGERGSVKNLPSRSIIVRRQVTGRCVPKGHLIHFTILQ